MKKYLYFILLLIFSVTLFCQQSNPSPTLTKQDFLQKNKKQKKAARIMMGGGATLILTSILIPKGEIVRESFWPEYKNDGIKSSFFFCGTLSMLSSIPFFISSAKNKKKAMSLSFKTQQQPQLQTNKVKYTAIPSLSIKIGL